MSGNYSGELKETTTLANTHCDTRRVSTWGKTGVERGGPLKQAHLFVVANPDLATLEGALSVSSRDPTPQPSLHPSSDSATKMTVLTTTHPLNLERECFKESGRGRWKKSNSVNIK